ncbi:HNH endonuclease [Sandarakinorhabdus sp. DWP1-3-1]|uniref:HNH endonuclease n=1 Tax=Sandarakinorhabdus sp. DWP1-3-1 TaxID=2804627 RepID=UPI003CF46ADC
MADDMAPAGKRNPPWTRDELVLALDMYVRHGGKPLPPTHPEVRELSGWLAALAQGGGSATFRNANGVAMKLMNFRALDPAYVSSGGVGLSQTGRGDKAVWAEFAGRAQALAVEAGSIRSRSAPEAPGEPLIDYPAGLSAPEGKAEFRTHLVRERNATLVAKRKQMALAANGRLACEACDFDFAERYGERGLGFIEAHHVKPVHAMQAGEVTKVEDLALLCANCHRMVHSAKPWLTLAALSEIVRGKLKGVNDGTQAVV